MAIKASLSSDVDVIMDLYEQAREYQKPRYHVVWPYFEQSLVEREISENKQWKIEIDGTVACVWATAYDDPEIWEERNADPSVYIHRIATNPKYSGQRYVEHVVKWAEGHAKELGKEYIRLDTVGENQKLILHYTRCGFEYLGMFVPKDLSQLPAHYHNAEVALFQKKID